MSIESLMEGKVIVIKPEGFEAIPLFCPLCSYPMKTLEDGIAYRQTKVCQPCSNHWAYRKNIDLATKSFATEENDEWLEYMRLRKLTNKIVINFE